LNFQRNQIAVTAAAFVGFTGFTLVMPFLPLYIQELGVRDDGEVALWAGLAMGVTPAVAALCGPLWGRVGDRFGNKILVQRSLLSFVIVMSAMAYVTEAWHLFALRAVQGLVAGYGALTISMAALSAPPDRMASAIGTVQTAQRLGPAIGPVIGGVLAPLVGLRNAFFASAAVYAVAFILLTVLYQEPPRVAAHPSGRATRVTFGNILAFENFLLLMLVIFGLQLVDRSFGPILPLYLGQIGFASDDLPVLSGILFSVLAFSGALGNQLAPRALQRFSARVTIAAASLLAAGALALFARATDIWILALSAAVFGVAIGTSLTTAFAAGGSVIPRDAHGASFGVLTSASLVGVACSPVLAGLVGARSIRVVFAGGVVVLVALAIVVRRVMVERTIAVTPAPAVEES
jgi:MFS family permease